MLAYGVAVIALGHHAGDLIRAPATEPVLRPVAVRDERAFRRVFHSLRHVVLRREEGLVLRLAQGRRSEERITLA